MKRYYERFYNSDAKVRHAVALLPWKHNLLETHGVRNEVKLHIVPDCVFQEEL